MTSKYIKPIHINLAVAVFALGCVMSASSRTSPRQRFDEMVCTCVGTQYDSNGQSEDASKCRLAADAKSCGNQCYKYTVTGNTSECKDCQETINPMSYCCCQSQGSLPGTKYHSECTLATIPGQAIGTAGCTCKEPWVLDGPSNVPCYHATGDACWF
jgi:hypothetical protein